MDEIIKAKTHQVMEITSGTEESQNSVVMKRTKAHYTQSQTLSDVESRAIGTTNIVVFGSNLWTALGTYLLAVLVFRTKENGYFYARYTIKSK